MEVDAGYIFGKYFFHGTKFCVIIEMKFPVSWSVKIKAIFTCLFKFIYLLAIVYILNLHTNTIPQNFFFHFPGKSKIRKRLCCIYLGKRLDDFGFINSIVFATCLKDDLT